MQLTCFDNFVCSRITKFGQDFNGKSRKMMKIFADERHKSAKTRGKGSHFAGAAKKNRQKIPKFPFLICQKHAI